MTADSPAEVVLMLRSAAIWRHMEEAHHKLGAALKRRREEPVRYYLHRLAALFSGAPPPDRERPSPSPKDFETEELVFELRRRVREDRDPLAAWILGVSVRRARRLSRATETKP